jgi:hypothetical protein
VVSQVAREPSQASRAQVRHAAQKVHRVASGAMMRDHLVLVVFGLLALIEGGSRRDHQQGRPKSARFPQPLWAWIVGPSAPANRPSSA